MSTITTTYPVQNSNARQQATSSARPRPWGFWATLAWFGVVSAIVFAMPYVMPYVATGASWALTALGVPTHTASLVLPFLMLAVAMTTVVMIPVFAARLAGFTARDYLGLVWPHWRHVVIGFGLLAAFGLAFIGLHYLFPSIDQSTMWIGAYRSIMGNTAALVLFLTYFVLVAPAMEELVFRGFLMRGWSETRLGVAGAIVLTSLIFAAIHTHHGPIGMALVFTSGALFGLMRWQSGSTLLSIMMHVARNLAVVIWVAMSV